MKKENLQTGVFLARKKSGVGKKNASRERSLLKCGGEGIPLCLKSYSIGRGMGTTTYGRGSPGLHEKLILISTGVCIVAPGGASRGVHYKKGQHCIQLIGGEGGGRNVRVWWWGGKGEVGDVWKVGAKGFRGKGVTKRGDTRAIRGNTCELNEGKGNL